VRRSESVLAAKAAFSDRGDESDGEKDGAENNDANLEGHKPRHQRARSSEILGDRGRAHENTTPDAPRLSPTNLYCVPKTRTMRSPDEIAR
jgi:hypothetical protein